MPMARSRGWRLTPEGSGGWFKSVRPQENACRVPATITEHGGRFRHTVKPFKELFERNLDRRCGDCTLICADQLECKRRSAITDPCLTTISHTHSREPFARVPIAIRSLPPISAAENPGFESGHGRFWF
jgi:hypothetical protein